MKRRGEKGRQNGCETKTKKKMNDYKATKKVKSLICIFWLGTSDRNPHVLERAVH